MSVFSVAKRKLQQEITSCAALGASRFFLLNVTQSVEELGNPLAMPTTLNATYVESIRRQVLLLRLIFKQTALCNPLWLSWGDGI
jgi:hypothetical protein